MARLWTIPFWGRTQAQSLTAQQYVLTQAIDPQKHSSFGLVDMALKKSKFTQLEWEFGTEPNELFQLRAGIDAPANQLTIAHATPDSSTSVAESARTSALPLTGALLTASEQRSEHERWRKPVMKGEILSPDTVSPPETAVPSVSLPSPNGQVDPLYSRESNRSNHTVAYHEEQHGISTTETSPSSQRHIARSSTPLASLFTGEEGMRRVLATRIALDEAIDRWWTHSELAPQALLRDGLLVLEAGHDLDETQRSFLLRTALRRGRGTITALHYQIDADRTAFLLKEALLDTKHPFDPIYLHELYQEDGNSTEWLDYLEHDLAYEATVATGKRSELAAAALAELQHPTGAETPADRTPTVESLPAMLTALSTPLLPPDESVLSATSIRPLSHRWSLRWLFWALLILILLFVYGPPKFAISAPMIQIPGGTYVISDPASGNPAVSNRFHTVTLEPYAIDQHEVTNAAYRRCWEANHCPMPSSFDSETRPGYFVDRVYSAFPVVNVNWEGANAYCAWGGKRLPTLDEWEVAASLAPATGRRFLYPWGDRFDQHVANSARSTLNDTQTVGIYHPAGSTSLGIMDLAGNVAEWTSMSAASIADGAVVKGGSFRDEPEQLRNNVFIELPRSQSEPWLGFRCAADR